MRYRLSEQTERIERELLPLLRRRLGRNFVSLVCEGSRAYGDDRADSDYDAICFVRDARGVRLPLAALERHFGVRMGIGVRRFATIFPCLRGGNVAACPWRSLALNLKLGGGRVVGGRDIVRELPAVSKLLPRDWRAVAQRDYWLSIAPDLPTCLWRREPRRHVGFVIAICDALLLNRGVFVAKCGLPAAMKRHHPRFHVIGLLRRALWRRANWPAIEHDRRQILGARRDARKFLEELRRYVFPPDGSGVTETEARAWRKMILATE